MMMWITAKPLRQGVIDPGSWMLGGCAGKMKPRFVCDSAKMSRD